MATDKGLHERNLHNDRYNFEELIKSSPDLKKFVRPNQYDDLSIDFSNSYAVMELNKAILIHFYNIKNWSIPKGNLCPPIPGRADYVHHIADLLATTNKNSIPKGSSVRGLDIGVGTGCIYPILGSSVYNWSFVATDIAQTSLDSCQQIIDSNHTLKSNVTCRLQQSPTNIFKNIIQSDEKFDFAMCNPPFHASLKEAKLVSARKVRSLNRNKEQKGHGDTKIEMKNNFGGEKAELWCPGGEVTFITNMINESVQFKDNCKWFTTLISKTEHLFTLKEILRKQKPKTMKVIKLSHGQKQSHILAWSFLV
jgi:23S rRNA (adenine1618-N6)-methyltransferase